MSGSRVRSYLFFVLVPIVTSQLGAQGTRLLRQPALSPTHVAFAYGGDLWITERSGGVARRLTSTAAVEGDPHFSPDGRMIAFTSNRSGTNAVYVVSVDGGQPTRLTWYPAASYARGMDAGRRTRPLRVDSTDGSSRIRTPVDRRAGGWTF